MKLHLAGMGEAKTTKERIMLEAAILFAQRGFADVSVTEIASCANIKSASLYNHFKGKEALYEAILENIKSIYLSFYDRLEEDLAGATNFEQMLDSYFAELIDVYHIYIYYGFSLITTEQFRDPKAYDIFTNTFLKASIAYDKAKFDLCVRNKWVKPFDTEALATFLNNNIVVGTLMRTHEDMNHETAYDVSNMFRSLKSFVLNSVEIVKQGEN